MCGAKIEKRLAMEGSYIAGTTIDYYNAPE